jgi:hypothetical protein
MSYNIADFSHRYIETGVIKDYNFVLQENPPPDDIDMDDPKEHLAWLCNPRHPTYGNILIDSSSATIEKLQVTSFETISWNLPLLLKMPLASKQLVSFQNCQWIYTKNFMTTMEFFFGFVSCNTLPERLPRT